MGDMWMHYDFSEGSGTTTADLSGSCHTGTLVNGPARVPGLPETGNALQFDGVSQQHVDSGTPLEDITVPFSVALWVKTGSTQAVYANIAGMHDTGGWTIQRPAGVGQNVFEFIIGTDSGWTWGSDVFLNFGSWHHLVVAVSPTSWASGFATAGVFHVYVDGVLVGRDTYTGRYYPPTTMNICVGRGHTTVDRFFNGIVDNFRIYSRDLTPQEVAELYAATAPSQTSSASSTISVTESDDTLSLSDSETVSVTIPITPTETLSGDTSTITTTGSLSATSSLVLSASSSASLTLSVDPTPSVSLSLTRSHDTGTISSTGTISFSLSPSVSLSETESFTVSPPPTPTSTVSFSLSTSLSETDSQSQTLSKSLSPTGTSSSTVSPTTTVSVSQSIPETLTSTDSLSETVSQSETLSNSLSPTGTLSSTVSPTTTVSVSQSIPETLTSTESLSETDSQSQTLSKSLSSTCTQSRSPSPTTSATQTISESRSWTASQTPTTSFSVTQTQSETMTPPDTRTQSSTATREGREPPSRFRVYSSDFTAMSYGQNGTVLANVSQAAESTVSVSFMGMYWNGFDLKDGDEKAYAVVTWHNELELWPMVHRGECQGFPCNLTFFVDQAMQHELELTFAFPLAVSNIRPLPVKLRLTVWQGTAPQDVLTLFERLPRHFNAEYHLPPISAYLQDSAPWSRVDLLLSVGGSAYNLSVPTVSSSSSVVRLVPSSPEFVVLLGKALAPGSYNLSYRALATNVDTNATTTTPSYHSVVHACGPHTGVTVLYPQVIVAGLQYLNVSLQHPQHHQEQELGCELNFADGTGANLSSVRAIRADRCHITCAFDMKSTHGAVSGPNMTISVRSGALASANSADATTRLSATFPIPDAFSAQLSVTNLGPSHWDLTAPSAHVLTLGCFGAGYVDKNGLNVPVVESSALSVSVLSGTSTVSTQSSTNTAIGWEACGIEHLMGSKEIVLSFSADHPPIGGAEAGAHRLFLNASYNKPQCHRYNLSSTVSGDCATKNASCDACECELGPSNAVVLGLHSSSALPDVVTPAGVFYGAFQACDRVTQTHSGGNGTLAIRGCSPYDGWPITGSPLVPGIHSFTVLSQDGRVATLDRPRSPLVGFKKDPRVWVTSVAGCIDAFPSSGLCTPKSDTRAITVFGANFNSSMRVVFESLGAPSVSCNQTVFVSDSQLECRGYNTFGHNKRVQLVLVTSDTSLLLPALGPPSLRLSFAPLNEHLCGRNSSGYWCSGHGSCDANTGACVCAASLGVGYWTGEACDQCDARYNSTGCTVPCPGYESGLPCSGRGQCFNGVCHCEQNYYGANCDSSCPGYGDVCSGHGTCSNNLECQCFANTAQGYWSVASLCSACSAGYSGSSCTLQCPVDGSGNICSAQGTCHEGRCFCNSGYCGDYCQESGDTCTACPSGYFGPDCNLQCEGGASNPCSGHGRCSEGPNGDGTCQCDTGYARAACDMLCPGGALNICSGHGHCNGTTAVCSCQATYGGSSCANRCGGAELETLCYGHGVCSEGSSGTGSCVCAQGYAGAACNATCPGGTENPCSLRGICKTDGTCECYSDATKGYFTGDTCDRCQTDWYSAFCNQQCEYGSNGEQCSGPGHGTCSDTLSCDCYSDDLRGFWVGGSCGECKEGYYGEDCRSECPEGACNACAGHGDCFDGRTGNGTCACYGDSELGYWSDSSNCTNCTEGYYGVDCLNYCPVSSDGGLCGGNNGQCFWGTDGNGTCSCVLPYGLDSDGLCLECASGYYGTSCDPCGVNSSVTNISCSGNGTCSDGNDGDGTCACDDGRGGTYCEFSCPVSNGFLCGEHGQCVGDDTCECSTNWTVQSDGTCSDCDTTHWGTDCVNECQSCAETAVCAYGESGDGSCTCPTGYWGEVCTYECPGGASSPCNNHGTCSATTGECTCHSNGIDGYWEGSDCSYCDPLYESTNCTVRCPTNDNEEVCSNRATCSNGECSACVARSDDLFDIYCGAACDQAGRASCSSSCPTGYYGTPNCTDMCPGYDGSTDQSVCSDHGVCGSTGLCYCDISYGGSACEFECPAALVNGQQRTCSGNGRCVDQNQCECVYGYTGDACNLQCPVNPDSVLPCSGRSQGQCNTLGLCECINGYVGTYCQHLCPNSTSETQCGEHGYCNDNGVCECYQDNRKGYYSGTSCERCAVFYYGDSCLSRCGANAVSSEGSTCICAGHYGGPDCNLVCPGLGQPSGLCSSHGTCPGGSTTNATCQCDDGFYGADCSVGCSTEDCIEKEGLINPTCDSEGQCVCQVSGAGSFGGPTCADCALGFWGVACNLRCQCNDHGSCARNDGACQCFFDSIGGFWAGESCERCADGYVGTDCRSKNVQLSLNDHRGASAPVLVESSEAEGHFLQDREYGAGYAGNRPLVLLNLTNYSHWTYVTSLTLGNGTVLALHIDEATNTIRIQVQSTTEGAVEEYSIPRGLSVSQSDVTLVSTDDTSRRRMAVQAAAGSTGGEVLYSLRHPSDQSTVIVRADRTVWSISNLGIISMVANLSTSLGTVHHAVLSNDTNYVIIAGRATEAKEWVVYLSPFPLTLVSWQVFTQDTVPIQSCAATAYGCDAAQRCTLYKEKIYCMLTSSSGPIVASFGLSSSNGFQPIDDQTVYYTPALYEVTAMELDTETSAQLLLVALNAKGESTTVLKIDLNGTIVSGELQLERSSTGEPKVVRGFAVQSFDREMFAVVPQTYSMELISINLFGIKHVVPDVLDSSGGTVVTVIGEGFNPAQNPEIHCDFGSGEPSIGRLVDSTRILCSTTVAAGVASGCVVNNMNIEILGRRTSTTNVPVVRPTSVVIRSAWSEDGERFSDSTVERNIVLVGYGFVASNYAKCALTVSDSTILLDASFINGTAAVCSQPAAMSSTKAGTVMRYSHDGTIFSTSAIPYAFVGSAASLRIASPPSGVKVSCAAVTILPTVVVHVADQHRNSLYGLDRATRAVTLVARREGSTAAIDFSGNSSLAELAQDGVATFAGLTLAEPPLEGLIVIEVMFQGISTWIDQSNVFIIPGNPDHMAFVNTIASWRIGVLEDLPLDPTPEIKIVDVAGNEVTDQKAYPRTVSLAYEYDSPAGKETKTQSVNLDVTSGHFKFDAVRTRGYFGGSYVLTFSASGLLELTTTTLPLQRCDSILEFGRPLTYACKPCPEGGICDGLNLAGIQQGYWRPAADSYTPYACTSGACGAGGCKVGYQGPKCSVCEDGYGKAGSQCVKCLSGAVNWLIIVVIVIVVIVGVSIFTLNSMGNPDTEIGKAKDTFPIVVKMLLTFMQLIGQATDLTAADYSVLSDFFEGQQQSSAITTEFPFMRCNFHLDFYDEYVSMNVLPVILSLLVALGVTFFVVVAPRLKRKPKEDPITAIYLEERERNRRQLMESGTTEETVLGADEFSQMLRDIAGSTYVSPKAETPGQRTARRRLQETTPKNDTNRWNLVNLVKSASMMDPPAESVATHHYTEGEFAPSGSVTVPLPELNDEVATPSGHPPALHFENPDDDNEAPASQVSAPLDPGAISTHFRPLEGEGEDAVQVLAEAKELQESVARMCAHVAHMEEKDLEAKLKKRRTASRIVEVFAVTLIVVLFLFYPTLLMTAAKMLRCEDIDFGDTKGLKSLLIADRNIDCTGDWYVGERKVSIFLLLFWGFGIPIFSVVAVKVIQKLTLYNHAQAAQTLFFFMTGGFKQKYWFWEATVMARKAFLLIIIVLVNDSRLKTYLSVWLMLGFFVLQITVQPYQDVRLSRLETSSLACIIVTLNLLMLQPQFDPVSSPELFHGLIIVVILVNCVMFVVYLVVLFITGKAILRSIVYSKKFLAFLRPLFEKTNDDIVLETKALVKERSSLNEHIQKLMPRDSYVEFCWNYMAQHPEETRRSDAAMHSLLEFEHRRKALLVELEGPRRKENLLVYYDAERELVLQTKAVKHAVETAALFGSGAFEGL